MTTNTIKNDVFYNNLLSFMGAFLFAGCILYKSFLYISLNNMVKCGNIIFEC